MYGQQNVKIRSSYVVYRRYFAIKLYIMCTMGWHHSNIIIRYSVLLLGYKPVQHVTLLNTVDNCNTVLSIIVS